MRYKLAKELMQHEGLIIRSHQLIDPSTTEYYDNQAYNSRTNTMTPYARNPRDNNYNAIKLNGQQDPYADE